MRKSGGPGADFLNPAWGFQTWKQGRRGGGWQVISAARGFGGLGLFWAAGVGYFVGRGAVVGEGELGEGSCCCCCCCRGLLGSWEGMMERDLYMLSSLTQRM